MELDKGEAAHTLTRLLAVRDFKKDLALQQKVYKQELGKLVENLRQAVREFSGSGNPNFSLTLDISSTFALFIKDGTSTPALTACYIDTSQSGTIRLNFIPRGLEQRHEDLVLDSPGQFGYQWRSGDILVTTFVLHEYIMQRVFEVASEAVRNEIIELHSSLT
jgi:hypothetical protein